ncbi:MAG TPA: hypothetical protein VE028_01415 [Nitratidesulfovibrio sp.]|nr:hypothetical protein [Nitratidesulfovibrio sp.]
MKDIKHALYIKYGLSDEPASSDIGKWLRLAEQYIAAGDEPELAGAKAAKAVFPGFKSCVRLAQADTIKTLLEAARRK